MLGIYKKKLQLHILIHTIIITTLQMSLIRFDYTLLNFRYVFKKSCEIGLKQNKIYFCKITENVVYIFDILNNKIRNNETLL